MNHKQALAQHDIQMATHAKLHHYSRDQDDHSMQPNNMDNIKAYILEMCDRAHAEGYKLALADVSSQLNMQITGKSNTDLYIKQIVNL